MASRMGGLHARGFGAKQSSSDLSSGITQKMALPLFVCIIMDKVIEEQGQKDTALHSTFNTKVT